MLKNSTQNVLFLLHVSSGAVIRQYLWLIPMVEFDNSYDLLASNGFPKNPPE